jgi:hypothetical protein
VGLDNAKRAPKRAVEVRNGYISDRFSVSEVVPWKVENRLVCRYFAVRHGMTTASPVMPGRARAWTAVPAGAC